MGGFVWFYFKWWKNITEKREGESAIDTSFPECRVLRGMQRHTQNVWEQPFPHTSQIRGKPRDPLMLWGGEERGGRQRHRAEKWCSGSSVLAFRTLPLVKPCATAKSQCRAWWDLRKTAGTTGPHSESTHEVWCLLKQTHALAWNKVPSDPDSPILA